MELKLEFGGQSCGVSIFLPKGTKPEKKLVAEILRHYCEEKEVKPVLQTEAGVEAVLREKGERQFLFLLNHRDEKAKIKLNGRYKNLLTEAELDTVELPVFGYAVLERQR